MSLISVVAPSYAQKRPSVPSAKEFAKKSLSNDWAREWLKLKEEERKYKNSAAGRQAASPNRFPLLKDIAADVLDEQKDHSNYYPKPNASERDRQFIEKITAKKGLYPTVRRMFKIADHYLANLNKRLDEAEAAAKSCDRARYDAAIKRLIDAYVEASLYFQRQLDNLDALAQAGAEYEAGNYDKLRRRWTFFWAEVHDSLSEGKTADAARRDYRKNSLYNRANLLGQVFSTAYGDMLKRMNAALKTADYPPFKECKKPVKGLSLADADAALAEAKAAERAMDEMEGEFNEQDQIYKKLSKKLDDLIGDASLPDTRTPAGKGSAKDIGKPGKSGISQSPVAPKPAKNPNGSFMEAPMPVPMADIVIDLPKMPKLPVLPKNSPLAKYQANPCGLDARKVCNVLLKDFRANCTKELTAFYKICKKAPSIRSCKQRCQANWQQGKHELALASLAKKHIIAVFGVAEKSSDGILEGKEAEIKGNENRMNQIEEEAKKRVLHIYINQNTGTIIRHNGNKFVPKPPLRYAGTQGGRPHMYERNTIEYLKARNKQLQSEIEGLADDAYATGSWPQMALSKWTPNAKKSDGHCTAPQNDRNRASCLATCDGRAPAGVSHSCYSSYVPQLALPYGRRYLYPPGHPKSKTAKGSK
ncbi:MAG: hypothetical protein GKS01_14015 [Alphaproteobacteria bacterium]|nr:hypothetical protein [Alphaproteobacteria bacterium]